MRVDTIIIHNLLEEKKHNSRGICCLRLGSDAGAAAELLHRIASLTLVVYLAPSTVGDSFSNKPHKSDHIYG